LAWPSKFPNSFTEKGFDFILNNPCVMTAYTIDHTGVPGIVRYDINGSLETIHFSASYLPATCQNHKPFKANIRKFASATASTPLPTPIVVVDRVDVG